jgi:molecular chaperone HtpG
LPAGEAVRWTSDGRGEYSLETIDRPDQGTTIVLHLRDGEEDLLSPYRLRKIIQKYSDHINVPIVMPSSEKPDEGEDQRINAATALWARPKSEISEAEYIGYYRHSTNDFDDPLAYLHTKVEGRYEYTLLLYIPSKAPHDLWTRQPKQRVKLHVQRVFILEDTGQLLPRYLQFVRGVIDSADLPLNVSRELLQTSLAVEHIRTSAVRRVLKLLGDLATNEPEKYAAFWKEFGAVLKEGVADDFSNRDELARLLRFPSTTSDEETSLSDYVSRMKEGQSKIYYLLAPSLAAAKASPHLEAFRAKGIEVLLLGQGVDNFVVTNLPQGYEEHPFQSVTQGPPDFGELADEEEKAAAEQADADNTDLVGKLKAALSGLAWDVRVTSRLTTSPACIVSGEAETDFTLAQRMRGTGLPKQPILEINPRHPLIERLNAGQDDPRLSDWAQVLFNQAVLTFGARIENPAAFVGHLNDLLISLAAQPR